MTTSDMRALTVRQPYAYAIACGEKTIENRTWNTTYRGLIAIHSAARPEPAAAFARVAMHLGLALDDLRGRSVLGALVAVARLTGVCSNALPASPMSPVCCGCGAWAVNGQRHFQLADIRPLPEPIPTSGALNLWPLGAGLERRVLAAIGGAS